MKYLIVICLITISPIAFASVKDVEALDVIAKTLYHEARGEDEKGIRAVATTLHNRAMKRHNRPTPEAIVKQAKKRKQYSCWNGKRDLKAGSGKSWVVCRKIAYEMVSGEFKPTHSHTHYYAQKIVFPKWAKNKPKVIIGNHTFLTVKC